MNVEQLVFSRRHRMCTGGGLATGDGTTVAMQFDAVLMSIGFKCSARLLTELGALDPSLVIGKAVDVLAWAREETGAHRRHNAYFIDFPAGVPDTQEFWAGLLRDAVAVAVEGGETEVRAVLGPEGAFALDLLSLPGYGTYQHTYAEMVARHALFEPLLKDKLTIVHAGGAVEDEALALFTELAGSTVPLSGDRLEELRFLAGNSAPVGSLITDVPVRENLAVINAVRARLGMALKVTTVTDVLRAAAELSGSDVTLAGKVRFTSQPRQVRRALMGALDEVLSRGPNLMGGSSVGLEDIPPRAELWKRLGERLHPHEFGQFDSAMAAFMVARGETDIRSRASQAETCFSVGAPEQAARVMRRAPGELWRSADRILRMPASTSELRGAIGHLASSAPHVSGRVLLGTRQSLVNRVKAGGPRIFPVRSGKAWVTPDVRPLLDEGVVRDLNEVIDAELVRRLPQGRKYLVDRGILGAALPLTGKGQAEGLGVWPRGSVSKLGDGEWLRFFFYWKQAAHRTDYDLSCLFVDDQFRTGGHLSYTNLSSGYGEHSGDITDAPRGATEFINIHLDHVAKGMTVIPQVYLYNSGGSYDAGETFEQVEENFLGYMTLSPEQRGLPFEARTVRMKTVVRGEHRAVMPVVFFRGDDGDWYAKWLHLGLKGAMSSWGGYRVEENKVTTELLARSFMARQYLQVRYLVDALRVNNVVALSGDMTGGVLDGAPVTYIGIEQPENLPAGAEVFTLGNLGSLVPA
jgi:hypothetical protein